MRPESMTILTVDDTPANIRLLTHYLEKQGYRVITAEDGFEGFKAAIQYHPDLILLDVMMPGTDGYEVCELLKAEEETKDIPIMFLTAKADVEDKVRGFELGAVDYITKPFNLVEISTRVENQLTKKHIQRQNARYRKLLQGLGPLLNRGKLAELFANTIRPLLEPVEAILGSISDPDEKTRIEQLIALLKRFDALMTPDRPNRGSVRLKELIESVIDDLEEILKGRIAFESEISNEIAFVGDKNEIYQTFWNVLYNAYLTNPGGEPVQITAEEGVRLPESLAHPPAVGEANAYLCVRIVDPSPFSEEEALVCQDPLRANPESDIQLRYAGASALIQDHEGMIRMLPGDSGRVIEIYLPS